MLTKCKFVELALIAAIFGFLTVKSLQTGSPEGGSKSEGTTDWEPDIDAGLETPDAADMPSSIDASENIDRLEERSFFEEYANALNQVSSGNYKQIDTLDLYDLLDDLVLVYHGDPVIHLAMAQVRVELARRGETEPLALIVDTANTAEAGTASHAISDLAKVGTDEAINYIVALLEDNRPGAGYEDVGVLPPSDVAAFALGELYPISPLGPGDRDRAAKVAFAEWWKARRSSR